MKVSVNKFSILKRTASLALLASLLFSNAFAVTALLDDTRSDIKKVAANASAIAKYTTDLTQLGREGRLRENLSFEKETARLIKVLAEGGARNPVIIDEDKATQDTIVDQLAIRMAKGSVSANLAGKKLIKLEAAVLYSNTRSEAEVAAAYAAILDEVVASNGKTILYTDELTNLIGSGAARTSLVDGLSHGKLSIIGASPFSL